MRRSLLALLVCLLTAMAGVQVHAAENACVILLHGLARSEKAMTVLEEALVAEGYDVVNVSYPSREHAVEELAVIAVEDGLDQCAGLGAQQVNFVTHSLGGILVRQYAQGHKIDGIYRVVMLGPPNQGSEVVDTLGDVPGFDWLNGPAGQQLGTGETDVPASLGPVPFETGIIAGNRTINLVLSQFLPNPDDGKVSVASTRVEGMCAFVELPVSHALMMRNETVVREVLDFLSKGKFSSEGAENGLCKRSPPDPGESPVQ